MGLVDLSTDLKSLKFGKDRIGGGDSGQPYITKSIPSEAGDLDKTGGPDFLLRGGSLVVNRTIDDASRLTKMFFDTKSLNGLLFTGKQLLLSRTSPRTQASPIALNAGFYLPTSTILQSGVNALGIHLNKQGIDPTGLIAKKGVLVQPQYNNFLEEIKDIKTNRLLRLRSEKILSQSQNASELLKYDGGPGSILGIGRTRIGRYSNTRISLDDYKSGAIFADANVPQPAVVGLTGLALQFFGAGNVDLTLNRDSSRNNPKIKPDFRNFLIPPDINISNLPGTDASGDILNKKYSSGDGQNIDERTNRGNPGAKGNKSNFQKGKILIGDDKSRPFDKITALPLYRSTGVIQDSVKNDLVKFRIGVIDNNDPNYKTYIHFRAFIDSLDDSYSSQWSSTRFVGRGEELYRYGGYSRSVNLAWTVVAQSKDELIPMYQKLNYLASSIAPDYSNTGYMRGNLITLTVGGWFFEQVGFIEGINYSVPQESPWEIAIPAGDGLNDKSVKEMPHMIKVSGFKFTPLERFLPQIQKNLYENDAVPGSKNKGFDGKWISGFGPERYIQLSAGGEGKPGVLADNYGGLDGSVYDGNDNYININNVVEQSDE